MRLHGRRPQIPTLGRSLMLGRRPNCSLFAGQCIAKKTMISFQDYTPTPVWSTLLLFSPMPRNMSRTTSKMLYCKPHSLIVSSPMRQVLPGHSRQRMNTADQLLLFSDRAGELPHIQFSHWPIGQGPAECAKRLNSPGFSLVGVLNTNILMDH